MTLRLPHSPIHEVLTGGVHPDTENLFFYRDPSSSQSYLRPWVEEAVGSMPWAFGGGSGGREEG
jgi:hypothetical protein